MKTDKRGPFKTKRLVKRSERVVDRTYPSYYVQKGENAEIRRPRTRRSRSKRDTETSPATKAQNTKSPSDPQRDPVVFFTYAPSSDTTGQVSDNAVDPSGADCEAGVVVRTGNWYVDASTDNGATWKRYDRTTLFPKTPGNGSTSDHIVVYVASIDRFVWFMEHAAGADGSGAFRIAVAAPADIKVDFTKAWKSRWSFKADNFGLKGINLDFPELAVSGQFLYFSTSTVSGATNGLLVARLSLQDLAAGGSVGISYNNPADTTDAYLAQLAQGIPDGAVWVGHTNNKNDSLTLYVWPDSSASYTPTNVPIAVWPQNKLTGKSPNGNDWLSFLQGGSQYSVLAGTRTGNELWLGWTASSGKGPANGFDFPNAHVRIVRVDIGTMKVLGELQVWNPDYAFAYPSLNVNARGEVGIVLAWGGKNDNANAAAGILGDFVVWFQNGSDTTTARWGDFTTVRRAGRNRSLFAGFAYYTKKDTSRTSGYYFDPYYVVFGRQSAGP
jgi:hypothetical protein